MLKLKSVTRNQGFVNLTFEFDVEGSTATRTLDAQEIVSIFKDLKQILGRNPTQAEMKTAISALFVTIRKGQEALGVVSWENWIGVDLDT